jgi:hypothetical protein
VLFFEGNGEGEDFLFGEIFEASGHGG